MTAREQTAEVVDLPRDSQLYVTLGQATKQHIAGTLYEDYLPQLRGTQALRTYREMTNDATVASVLFAIDMLLRGVPWSLQRGDDTPASVAAEELIVEEFDDMQGSWPDHLSQVATALPFGFSFFETTYRQRSDGRIGWASFDFRPQDTLLEWQWQDGDPVGFVQSVDYGARVTIPLAKGVLYRGTSASTAPEGVSILRAAYRSWFFKKRTEEFMMLGLERDLTGIPMAKVPARVLAAGPGDAVYDAIKKVVTRTKRHEQEGIMWPYDVDPETGQPLYEFELLQGGGRPKMDAIAVQRLFATDIAATVLAQFIMLGRDAVGSRALAEPQQELFQSALVAWADAFEAAFHEQATRRLLELNGLGDADVRWVHGPVKDADIAGTAVAAKDFAAAGVPMWTGADNDPIVDQVRGMLGFDPAPEVSSDSFGQEQETT